MANVDCSACTDLKEFAPDFVQNGVTTTVCNSLKNDTGLNPTLTTLHNDCDDLDTANDCLIGMMDKEIEAYDVCDWKEFAHKFIPNLHQLTKAEICTICGLWTSVHDLEEKTAALCEQLDATIKPPIEAYGAVYNDYGTSHPDHRGGTINVVNGQPAIIPATEQEVGIGSGVWKNQNIGIRHAKMVTESCSTGVCKYLEWIAPDFTGCKINSQVSRGDILWYVDKTTALGWGVTEKLWDAFDGSSWTWTDYGVVSNRTNAWVRLEINPSRMGSNYLTIVWDGTSYPNESPGATLLVPPESPDRVYTFTC